MSRWLHPSQNSHRVVSWRFLGLFPAYCFSSLLSLSLSLSLSLFRAFSSGGNCDLCPNCAASASSLLLCGNFCCLADQGQWNERERRRNGLLHSTQMYAEVVIFVGFDAVKFENCSKPLLKGLHYAESPVFIRWSFKVYQSFCKKYYAYLFTSLTLWSSLSV